MTSFRYLLPGSYGFSVSHRHVAGLAVLALVLVMPVTSPPAPASTAPQLAPVASLVFDQATVVDVTDGKLVPGQRVVITGTRITAVGTSAQVSVPAGAHVVDARGKYLIPGLWDLHVHTQKLWWLGADPLWIALGVTGFRDAASLPSFEKLSKYEPEVPFDTLLARRREILAGTRLGSPRQILSGHKIDYIGRTPSEDVRQPVHALRAAGVDMLKMYTLQSATYFAIAAEARRVGLPFGGHTSHVTPQEASDSGAIILDHVNWLQELCFGEKADVAGCQATAERFRHNGTWWVPTLIVVQFGIGSSIVQKAFSRADSPRLRRLYAAKEAAVEAFLAGSLPHGNWLRKAMPAAAESESAGFLRVAHRVGMPWLTGTDMPWGLAPFSLHTELAMLVAEGLTPLAALQAATLNPAKAFRATDSLGTVTPGKLADLVLLDANPLADITNTTTIRAVVANGRYFDRAALDRLLTNVRTHPDLRRNLRQHYPKAIPE